MSNLAQVHKYQGGICYAACQDVFSWYNPNITSCRKGCDFGTGRVNDPKGRLEAIEMCKTYASELYVTKHGELENIKDLRVHADMFPTSASRIYRSCLAGVRRLKY